MNSETKAIDQLKNKLIRLGYSKSALRTDVKTPYGRMIDLAIYEFNEPKVVFEVKINARFPSRSETNEFRFHPVVRQAQSLSKEVHAPFFAVSDGEDILWFDIDEKEGRPRLLQNPILPLASDVGIDTTEYAKKRLLGILFELGDMGRGELISVEILTYVGMAIFARLRSESGNKDLEDTLLSPYPSLALIDEGFSGLELTKRQADNFFFLNAFATLDNIVLSNIPAIDFVDVLDEFIQFYVDRDKNSYLKLPLWITELMTNLAQVNSNDVVLDIYSTFGDGVSAINKLNKLTSVLSIVPNSNSYLWDKLKREILGLIQNTPVLIMTPQHYLGKASQVINQIDKVLVSPPFSGRSTSEGVFSHNEDVYLEAALNWVKPGGRIVAIVPENLLFSKSRELIRQFIFGEAWIRAVISLEQFTPGTSAKVSILVIDRKSPETFPGKTMMSKILSKDIAKTIELRKSILVNKKIQQLLQIYTIHLQNELLPSNQDYWFVPINELKLESWAVGSYDPNVEEGTTSQFPLYQLMELAELRKGSNLTLNKNGSLSVIGPAAVRVLTIDPTKLDRTSNELIPPSAITTRTNDILIHAVGPYRGQTAIVESDFRDCFISRNIIILYDLSPRILPMYLAVALNRSFVKKQLADRATGSVISLLTIRKLKDVLIPVPDLDTQIEIVKKVQNTRQKLIEIEQQALAIQSSLKEQHDNLQNLLDNVHLGGGENV